jgi:short-subunit dehydrogenase
VVSSEHRLQTAAVTGGTGGIGKEVARGLARQGLQVVVVGRDRGKGALAVDDIRQTTGNSRVEFLRADLALIGDTHRVADELSHRLCRPFEIL